MNKTIQDFNKKKECNINDSKSEIQEIPTTQIAFEDETLQSEIKEEHSDENVPQIEIPQKFTNSNKPKYEIESPFEVSFDEKEEKFLDYYFLWNKGCSGTSCIITGTTKKAKKLSCIIVPYYVTEIANDAFKNLTNLKYVRFNGNLQKIGARVFQDCSNLVVADFGGCAQSVEIIEERAFEGTKLEEIRLPSSVRFVGEKAFDCKDKRYPEKVYLPTTCVFCGEYDGHKWSAFSPFRFVVAYEGGTEQHGEEIPQSEIDAFFKPTKYSYWFKPITSTRENNQNFDTIYLPWGMETLSNEIFDVVRLYKNVLLQDNNELKKVEIAGFYDKKSYIQNLDLSKALCEINTDKIQYSEKSGMQIKLPKGKVKLGANAYFFADIKSFDLSPYEDVAPNAFQGSHLEEIVITKAIKEISYGAFALCKNLKKITVEEESSLVSVAVDAFEGCENLEFVDFSHAEKLKSNIFEVFPVHKIKTFLLPPQFANKQKFYPKMFALSSIETIAETEILDMSILPSLVFEGASLTEATIPSGTVKMEDDAFKNCKKIKKIDFEKGSKLETFNLDAFSGCSYIRTINFSNAENLAKIDGLIDSKIEVIISGEPKFLQDNPKIFSYLRGSTTAEIAQKDGKKFLVPNTKEVEELNRLEEEHQVHLEELRKEREEREKRRQREKDRLAEIKYKQEMAEYQNNINKIMAEYEQKFVNIKKAEEEAKRKAQEEKERKERERIEREQARIRATQQAQMRTQTAYQSSTATSNSNTASQNSYQPTSSTSTAAYTPHEPDSTEIEYTQSLSEPDYDDREYANRRCEASSNKKFWLKHYKFFQDQARDAKKGDGHACFQLGTCYSQGDIFVDKNESLAVYYYLKSIANTDRYHRQEDYCGDIIYVADAFFNGTGVKRNLTKALEYYRMLEEKSNHENAIYARNMINKIQSERADLRDGNFKKLSRPMVSVTVVEKEIKDICAGGDAYHLWIEDLWRNPKIDENGRKFMKRRIVIKIHRYKATVHGVNYNGGNYDRYREKATKAGVAQVLDNYSEYSPFLSQKDRDALYTWRHQGYLAQLSDERAQYEYGKAAYTREISERLSHAIKTTFEKYKNNDIIIGKDVILSGYEFQFAWYGSHLDEKS